MEDPDDTDISEEGDEFEQPGKCSSSAESHPFAAPVCLQDTFGMQAAQSNNLANNLAQAAQAVTVSRPTNAPTAALDSAPNGLSGCQQYGDSDHKDLWRPSERACDASGQPGGAEQPGAAGQHGTQPQTGGEQHGGPSDSKQGRGLSPNGVLEAPGIGAIATGWHGEGAQEQGLSEQHSALRGRHGAEEGAQEGPGRESPTEKSPERPPPGSGDRQSGSARQPKEEWALSTPRGPVQEFPLVGPIDLTDPELVADPLVVMAANNHRLSTELKALNRALEQRAEVAQMELEATRAERDALRRDVGHLEEDLRSKRGELTSLEEGTTRIAGKNRSLQSSVLELRTTLAETQEQCAHAHVDRLIYDREVQRVSLLQAGIHQLQERLLSVNGELEATQQLLAAERQLRGILEQEMQELQEAAAPLHSYLLKAGSKRQRTDSDDCQRAGISKEPRHQSTQNGYSLDPSAMRQRSGIVATSATEQNLPNGHGNNDDLSPASRELQGSPQEGASPDNLASSGGASPDTLANSWAGSGRQPGIDLQAGELGIRQPGTNLQAGELGNSRADDTAQEAGKGPRAVSLPPAALTSAAQGNPIGADDDGAGEPNSSTSQQGLSDTLVTGQQLKTNPFVGEAPLGLGCINSSTPMSAGFSYPASANQNLLSVSSDLPLPLPLNVPPFGSGLRPEQHVSEQHSGGAENLQRAIFGGYPTREAPNGKFVQSTSQGLAVHQQPPTSLMDVLITSRQPALAASQPASQMASQEQGPGALITQQPAVSMPKDSKLAEPAKAAEPQRLGSSETRTPPPSPAQCTSLAEAAKAAEPANQLVLHHFTDSVPDTLAYGAIVLPAVGARGIPMAAASDPGRQGPPADDTDVSSFVKSKPLPVLVRVEDSDPGSDGGDSHGDRLARSDSHGDRLLGDDSHGDRLAGNAAAESAAPPSAAAQEATPSRSGNKGRASSKCQAGGEEVEGVPTPSGRDTKPVAKRPKATERSRGGITKPNKRKSAGRGRGKKPGKGAEKQPGKAAGNLAGRGRGKGRGRGARARLGPPTSDNDASDDDVILQDTGLKRQGKDSLSKGPADDSLAGSSGVLGRGKRRSTAGLKSALSDDYVLD